jgi:hypothetical protein
MDLRFKLFRFIIFILTLTWSFSSQAISQTAPVVTGLTNSTVPVFSQEWTWGCTVNGAPQTCLYSYSVDTNPKVNTLFPQYSIATSTTLSGVSGTYYLHVVAKYGTQLSPVTTVSVVMTNFSASAAFTTSGGAGSHFTRAASDSMGNVYAVGQVLGTPASNSGNGTTNFGNGVTVSGFTSGPFLGSSYSMSDVADLPTAFIVKYDSNGVAQWGQTVNPVDSNGNVILTSSFKRPKNQSLFYGVSTDSSGNVYAVGQLYGVGSRYGFGNNVFADVSDHALVPFIVKYDSNGQAQWVNFSNTGNFEQLSGAFYGVSTDSSGNAVAVGEISSPYYSPNGQMSGQLQFAGSGVDVSVAASNYRKTGLVVKFSSTGVALWGQSAVADPAYSYFADVKVSPTTGDIFIAGNIMFNGLYDFGNRVTVRGAGSTDWNILLLKYNSSGVAQWAKSSVGGGAMPDNHFYGLALNAAGTAIYAVGYSYPNPMGTRLTFGLPASLSLGLYNFGIVVKYDTSGNAQWVRALGGTSGSQYYGVAVDSVENIYAYGVLEGQTVKGNVYNAGVTLNAKTISLTGSMPSSAVQGREGTALVVVYDSRGLPKGMNTEVSPVRGSGFFGGAVNSGGFMGFGFTQGNRTVCYSKTGGGCGLATHNFGIGVSTGGTFDSSFAGLNRATWNQIYSGVFIFDPKNYSPSVFTGLGPAGYLGVYSPNATWVKYSPGQQPAAMSPVSNSGWIAVDNRGSIYQGSISSFGGGVRYAASAVGTLPTGVLGSNVINIRYDGSNYVIISQSAGALISNSIFISSDLNRWVSWGQGLQVMNGASGSVINNSYFDGTRWWLLLYDAVGGGKTLFYRRPLDSQWSLAQGAGLPPWEGDSLLLFKGLLLFGQDRSGYGGSNLWWSSDGTSFNSGAVGMNSGAYWPRALATNGTNRVVASSNWYNNSALYSSDGKNWELSSSWNSISGNGPGAVVGGAMPGAVIFDGSNFYMGVVSGNGPPFLYRSTDGNQWSSQGISGVSNSVGFQSFWYDQGVYAVFDSVVGAVKVSTDGLIFTVLPHPVLGRSFVKAYPQKVVKTWD